MCPSLASKPFWIINNTTNLTFYEFNLRNFHSLQIGQHKHTLTNGSTSALPLHATLAHPSALPSGAHSSLQLPTLHISAPTPLLFYGFPGFRVFPSPLTWRVPWHPRLLFPMNSVPRTLCTAGEPGFFLTDLLYKKAHVLPTPHHAFTHTDEPPSFHVAVEQRRTILVQDPVGRLPHKQEFAEGLREAWSCALR